MNKYIDQRNWPSDLEAARLFAFRAIKEMKYKNSVPKLMRAVEQAPTVAKIQKVVINAIFKGDGFGVIR